MFIYKSPKTGQIIELKEEIKEFKGRLENYILLDSILTKEEVEMLEKQKERQEYKDKIKQDVKLYDRTIIIEEVLED